MKYKLQLRSHLRNIKKLNYIKEDENQIKIKIDCSFGVNPFGYSEKIDKHSIIDKTDIQNYPLFPYNDLKNEIINYWKDVAVLSHENIHVTSGSMLALDSINNLFIDKNDKVLGYSPQFPAYVNSVQIRGGGHESLYLEEKNNYKFMTSKFIEKIKKNKYKLIYVDNPNNPTGQIIDIKNIEKIVAYASSLGVCVIIDEAYGDYMTKENSAISLLEKYDNLFITRSFSKAYALASLRIGYVIASEELSSYYSIIDDLLLNPIGLEAAILSLQDKKFLPNAISKTVLAKKQLINSLKKFRILETNNQVPIFVLVHPREDVDLSDLLLKYNILATTGFENLSGNAVRIRIPAEINQLIKILSQIESDMENKII